MPSIQTNNFLSNSLIVQLDTKQLKINIYNTSLGKRWLDALKDNLDKQRILEKNFCWLGWADSKRDLTYLVTELNANIAQINSFNFNPIYPNIDLFSNDDFQYSADLPIGKNKLGKHLKHEACNKLHRYFEELQGSAWGLSIYYKQADYKTKYSIRQLNNICHEIESWVNADRKKACEPDWMRPSQIVTFLNAPRYKLKDDDYKLFQQNRYNREIGGVYLHWAQVGKTLFEVFRDEDAPEMTDALCSEVNHQVYYSGEFDIEWGQSITNAHNFKKFEIEKFKHWLKDNGYDWNDPKLALGYIKIGQVDMELAFPDKSFIEVYNVMKDNLNIASMQLVGSKEAECFYPYSLDSTDWKQIQIDYLKEGYESRSMR